MTKIIKMLPIAALFLGLFFFAGKAMMKEAVVQTVKSWVYNPALAAGCNPTLPQCYEEYNGDLKVFCKGEDIVCGIVAPQNATIPTRPAISSDLVELINDKDISTEEVFLKD